MKLVIPLDPTGMSHNRLDKLHWTVKRDIKAQWTDAVQWIAQSKWSKLPMKYPTVTYTAYFKTRHKRDQDNFMAGLVKYSIDGLTKAGVIEDDNSDEIDLRPIEFAYDKTKPRVEITLEVKAEAPESHSKPPE